MGVKMKYKNKDGIELSYTGNDIQSKLVKEVVGEAIKLLEHNHTQFTINFLRENFNIKEERSDEWRINQFNRNRSIEDQVSTIEEMGNKVNEISNS